MSKDNVQSESRLRITHLDYAGFYPQYDEKIEGLLKEGEASADEARKYSRELQRHRKKPYDDSQNYSLIRAVINNDLEQLEKLLQGHRKKGFDMNSTFVGGIRAIHIAAQFGYSESLDILKVNGAAFVTEKSPVHPLTIAALNKRTQVHP